MLVHHPFPLLRKRLSNPRHPSNVLLSLAQLYFDGPAMDTSMECFETALRILRPGARLIGSARYGFAGGASPEAIGTIRGRRRKRSRYISRWGRAFFGTGDLGFIRDTELFVIGRMKGLIVIRGKNHYPENIESTVGKSHTALRPNRGAA
uniref:Uncharacterized protein n=1 Tax=Candidatus Kentrum sp. TC TaxID=2126339 RepID=A0A451ABF8_9GAMM|nr:MAG: hypothetical protein BECKTC1821F_GA0114240_10937 [Candidatus Kentron sp. TC]